MTDTAKRVARGVKWLDRHAPGWEKRVALREFNIRNECRCVLGQVFSKTHGTYANTLKELNDEGVVSRRYAIACGFDVADSELDLLNGYAQLQHEWERVIRERRDEAK